MGLQKVYAGSVQVSISGKPPDPANRTVHPVNNAGNGQTVHHPPIVKTQPQANSGTSPSADAQSFLLDPKQAPVQAEEGRPLPSAVAVTARAGLSSQVVVLESLTPESL